MTFRVGQKVVCVSVTPFNAPSLGDLKKGGIYTVRWVGVDVGFPCIRVEEIVRPCGTDLAPRDTPYLALRFRPVVERKTDISIFTAMLNPSKVGADA